MPRLTKRLMRRALGTANVRKASYERTLHGLREGDHWQLTLGLVLAGIHYLQRTKPRKQLIHREVVRGGQAVVIHSRGSSDAPLVITRPAP